MGAFVGAVFFDVSFDVSGAQNRVGEPRTGLPGSGQCAVTEPVLA